MVIVLIAALAAILYIWTIRPDPEPVPTSKELVSVISSTPITPTEGVLEARILLPGNLSLEQWQYKVVTLGAALITLDKDPMALRVQAREPGKAVTASFIPATSNGYSTSGADGPGSLATMADHAPDLGVYASSKESQQPTVTEYVLTDPGKYDGRFSGSKDAVTEYVMVDPEGQVELELTLITRPDETSCLIAKATLQDVTMLPRLESHWQQVLSAYGFPADYSTLLAGTIDGDHTYNESNQLLTGIFQSLAVGQPMKMADGNVISWAGHSPRIKTALRDVRGEPINVQAAIRYHHLEETTHIYLGSPLIYRDY